MSEAALKVDYNKATAKDYSDNPKVLAAMKAAEDGRSMSDLKYGAICARTAASRADELFFIPPPPLPQVVGIFTAISNHMDRTICGMMHGLNIDKSIRQAGDAAAKGECLAQLAGDFRKIALMALSLKDPMAFL